MTRESRERMGGEGKRVPRRGKKMGEGIQERESLLLHPLPIPKTFQECMRMSCSSASILCLPRPRTVLLIRFSVSPFCCSLAKHSQHFFFLVSTNSNLIGFFPVLILMIDISDSPTNFQRRNRNEVYLKVKIGFIHICHLCPQSNYW